MALRCPALADSKMKFKARLVSLWEAVRGSYWFIPSTMSIAAMALSFLMVWIDQAIPPEWFGGASWLYTGTPSGARTLLATIASSMIGVAGVVFSITIVALTLASGQFGSRLLRNFMRDRGNQITLGTFLSAFLYCLLILRKIQSETDDGGAAFIPQLSMLVAVLLAVAGLGVLIFFIHHAASSIQAPNVISAVSAELAAALDALYPERMGDSAREADASEVARVQIPARFDEDSFEVLAGRDGYIQRIEAEQVMAAANASNLIVRVEHRPGQFVQRDDVVLRVWPRAGAEGAVLDALREAFTISDQRSLAQDAEFAIEQLVEVASRALSPGINDPFTAIQCVERLGAALSDIATRQMPCPYRVDQEGRLRVLAYPKTFGDFLDTAYNQIRQNAAKSLDVLLSMLEAMARIAKNVRRPDDRQCLAEHVKMVYDLAVVAAEFDRDRRVVERRYSDVQNAMRSTRSD